MSLVTRIAPTPSGYLHVGNIFSFYLTRIIADKFGGKLHLRIDDLDAARMRPQYLDDIFESLRFLGLNYEHGPLNKEDFFANYSQHLRISSYHSLIKELEQTGLLYSCICSRMQMAELDKNGIKRCSCKRNNLSLNTAGAALRILVPDDLEIKIVDETSGPRCINLFEAMGDFVVLRKERIPSYQVTSLVDDLGSGINYIVRGEDLLTSSAAQVYLANVLDKQAFGNCRFLHHPLLKDNTGSKLSKSAGSQSLKAMQASGISREKILSLVQTHANELLAQQLEKITPA